MANFDELIAHLNREYPDAWARGKAFEGVCKWFLTEDPHQYSQEFKNVWLWAEWPGRSGSDWGSDIGIDLVAERINGDLVAVQAKCYADTVPSKEIDSFIATSSTREFAERLLIATSDITRNTETKLSHQDKPSPFLLESTLREWPVDWLASIDQSRPAMPSENFHSGFVAIVGRANVGKSTLLNAMLGQKLAIVSPKPHTTRHKLLGVLNGEGFQASLLDTPGFLRNGRDQMDAAMSRQLASALADADLVMLVVEPRPPGDVEKLLIEQIKKANSPAVLAINKVDAAPKAKLLPVIQAYTEVHDFAEIVPVSGVEKDGIDLLLEQLVANLPEREAMFPDEMLTDRPVRFLVSEIIREKVFHLYEHEVPYDVAVEIEDYEEREGRNPDLVRATIYVDKASQKQLLIGKGGQALKEVGTRARLEIQEIVERPVFLELWVKVNPKWRRKAGFIQRLL